MQAPSTVPWQKKYLKQIFEEDIDPEKYVEEQGLKDGQRRGCTAKTASEKVIADNPQSVEDYHKAEKKKQSDFWWDRP